MVDPGPAAVAKSTRSRGRAGRDLPSRIHLYATADGGLQGEPAAPGPAYTAYDYELSRPRAARCVGTHTRAQQLKRAEHFLKAVVPEAEKANVRLALHPNDPPVPISRGSEQVMATVEHWKQYLDLVKSPYNGMTFDCGVTREMGEDPIAVCRYLGERDVINHVTSVTSSSVHRTRLYEVFLDDGQVDMYGVMKELVRQKYPRAIYPEHPRASTSTERWNDPHQYPGAAGSRRDL